MEAQRQAAMTSFASVPSSITPAITLLTLFPSYAAAP